VNGKFTEEQAKVYRAVYQAQEDILAAIKPSVSMKRSTEGRRGLAAAQRIPRQFIHGFATSSALDVHDAGLYDAPLPPGAVFTVEPGVYLPERGFGVRIEDQVLMLGNGKWRLLTAEFPRKLEDVEAWVAAARR